MRKTQILAVDDELSILKLLRSTLEDKDYEVVTATNGVEALKILEMELPDLVLLDINMPQMDGFEVCRRLREWSQVPIIMLSARDDEGDKVKCLDLGADDYITKPFGTDELVARVRAVIRRNQAAASIPVQPSFANRDLGINFAQRQVTVAGQEVRLTPTEYALLLEFVLNTEKVLTHEYLLKKVWGPEYGDEREYLHVFVRRLRSKLEPDPNNPVSIVTIPGIGYQFKSTA